MFIKMNENSAPPFMLDLVKFVNNGVEIKKYEDHPQRRVAVPSFCMS